MTYQFHELRPLKKYEILVYSKPVLAFTRELAAEDLPKLEETLRNVYDSPFTIRELP